MAAAQKFWAASTLQGRRWQMERRLDAVEQNDVDQLEDLLSNQRSLRPREMTAALEIAVMKKSNDYARCVQLLLHYGANPCATNGSGTPLLLLAADAGCLEIVRPLIGSGCDLNQRREDGATALHRAAWNDHVTILRVLAEAGAELNAADAQDRTPILIAAQGNRTRSVHFFIRRRVDVSVADEKGRTVTYWAAYHNDCIVMRTLLTAYKGSACLNQVGPGGYTPLMVAAANGYEDILDMLLNENPNLELRTAVGETALLLAAEHDQMSAVVRLIWDGADVNAANESQATSLMYVLDYACVVRELLSAGATPNVKTKQNLTPLWVATGNGRRRSVRLLLQANCDTDVRSGREHEKVPLQVAIYGGNLNIVQMIFLASVAKSVDMGWLKDYLQDANLQQQARERDEVLCVKEWLEERLPHVLRQSSQPQSLLFLCRLTIRRHVGCIRCFARLSELPLPTALRDYVNLNEDMGLDDADDSDDDDDDEDDDEEEDSEKEETSMEDADDETGADVVVLDINRCGQDGITPREEEEQEGTIIHQ